MTIRKFISSLLIVVTLMLIVVQVPINTSAAKYDVYEYEMYDESSVIITKYTGGVAEKLVIPEEIDGYPVKAIGEDAFSDAEIYEVELPETLEKIDDFAFWNTYLYEVYIPAAVSNIGIGAFSGGRFSAYDVAPENKTYKDVSGILFDDTTLVSYPTASIKDIPSYTFDIAPYAFMYSFNLTELFINTAVHTVGEGAFMYSSIESIDINAGFVDAYAFYGCENLKEVKTDTYSSFSPQAFEGSAWWDAQEEGLVYIDVVAYIYKGVAPEVIDIKPGTEKINGKAFAQQTTVKKINIPSSVHLIDYSAFDQCSALEEISVDPQNNEFRSEDGMLIYTGLKRLLVCPAGKSGEVTVPASLKEIEDYAFEYCEKITKINLPKNLKMIGEGAFFGCTGLEEIYIPDSVGTTGDILFYGCTALEDIRLPYKNTEIDILDFYDTAWFNSQPEGMVYLCDALLGYKGDFGDSKEIVIAEGTISVSEYAFTGLESVENVVLPQSLKKIGDYAFANCTGVKEFTVPAGVEEIGRYAMGIKVEFLEDGKDRRDWNSDVVIKGYKNSIAEIYAEDNRLEFVSIGEAEYPILLGDTNNDGIINIKDATTVSKFVAGLLWFTDFQLKSFDFNQDGRVNVKDTTAIQKYIAGIPYLT